MPPCAAAARARARGASGRSAAVGTPAESGTRRGSRFAAAIRATRPDMVIGREVETGCVAAGAGSTRRARTKVPERGRDST